MSFRYRFCVAAVAALMAISVSACGGAEERKAEFLKRGMEYYEAGDFVKASLELRNVLQIDPEHVDAMYLLGSIEEAKQNWSRAYTYYLKVAERDAGRHDVQLGLGRLYLLAREPGKAFEHAEKALEVVPGNADALMLRSAARRELGESDLALQDARRALETEPHHVDALAFLALAATERVDYESAAELLRRGIEAHPGHSGLRLMLANVHEDAGDRDAASAVLGEAIELEPGVLGHRVRLARLHTAAGDLDSAEKVLRDAVSEHPQDDAARMLLVEFLANERDFAAAVKQLRSFLNADPEAHVLRIALAQLHRAADQLDATRSTYRDVIDKAGTGPEGLTARVELARILAADGDLNNAESLVDEVLLVAGSDRRALTLRARIGLARGDPDAAINDLRAVLRDNPQASEALRLHGLAHLQRNEFSLAEDYLKRAVEHAPDAPEAYLDLARLYRQHGEDEDAEAILSRLVTRTDYLEGLKSLASVQVASGNWQGAGRTAEQLKASHPDNPFGFYVAGLVLQARLEFDTSMAQFRESLERAPGSIKPRLAMATSLVAAERFDEALAALDGILEDDPRQFTALALKGRLLAKAGDVEAAEESYRRAIAVAPARSDVYRHLAVLQETRGDPDAAAQTLQQAIEADGHGVQVYLDLAALHARHGTPARAIEVYEAGLERNPESRLLANNLAMSLVTHAQIDADVAQAGEVAMLLEGAQEAAYLDTLGWVRLKQGRVAEAVSLLERAVRARPDVPEFHYHLGMACLEAGRLEEARKWLASATKVRSVSYSGADEARRVLEHLNDASGAGGGAAPPGASGAEPESADDSDSA